MSATRVIFPRGVDFGRRSEVGSWSVCLRCRRAHIIGHCRVAGDWVLCPYMDCDARVLFDVVHWQVARASNEALPYRPVYGVVYDVWGVG